MLTLTQQHREIIARHPIGNSLDHFKKPLQDSMQNHASISVPHNVAINDNSKLRPMILSLLGHFSGHPLALDMDDSGNSIASKILRVLQYCQSQVFNYSRYQPLVTLVIDNASDLDIWSAVFDLINAHNQTTPPQMTPISYDSTPVTRSSDFLGSGQKRRLVEEQVFMEIKSRTYRDVEGFFEKYFEGKDWTARTMEIYETIRYRHVNGTWTDFPSPPTQTAVTKWFQRFQEEFLSGQPRAYYTTNSPKDLTGAGNLRQVDLLVKLRNTQVPHNWADIDVIGELKASDHDRKALLLQVGRYARDVFSCQPMRRYVHAFTLCGCEMDVWVFDRSGCYSPGPFNIHEKPDRFIQVIAGYTMMDRQELGLDIFTQWDNGSHLVQIQQYGSSDLASLQLEPHPFIHQRAIICRGTCCFLSKPRDSQKWGYVAKFSWTSDKRKPEVDLLEVARQRGVEGVAELVGHRRITSIDEIRSGLKFKTPYLFRDTTDESSTSRQLIFSLPPLLSTPSQTLSHLNSSSTSVKPLKRRREVNGGRKSKRSRFDDRPEKGHVEVTYEVEETQEPSLTIANKEAYENRVLRCLVISPAGRSIRKYEKRSELLGALCDAIKAHKSLYLKGNILHRDISNNNIIITDRQTTGHRGMLIDLDLAKEIPTRLSGARHRTGTIQFMAFQVLLGISHTYRHDLESFFYVLLWESFRHSQERQSIYSCETNDELEMWYRGSFKQISHIKHSQMSLPSMFEGILDGLLPEFDCIKPLCRELRGILFPRRNGTSVFGTPKKPEILYDPIIEAFEKTIAQVEAMEQQR